MELECCVGQDLYKMIGRREIAGIVVISGDCVTGIDKQLAQLVAIAAGGVLGDQRHRTGDVAVAPAIILTDADRDILS